MTEFTETAEQDQPRTVSLTPAEFAVTKAKVIKLNERAAKRGFTGTFEITGTRVEVTETGPSGLPVTKVMIKTAITGETPKYNGWAFLARVDAIGETFTLATAPGVEHVDRDLVRPGHCDHCSQQRARKATYLVQHTDGTVKNVGSTCIKDFLGWDKPFTFISSGEAEHDLLGVGHGGGDWTWTVDTVLAAAYAAIRAYGFTPSSGYGRSTRTVVELVIGAVRPTKAEEDELVALRQYAAEATEKAITVREWVGSDDFSGTSYVDNLKAAVAAGEASTKQLGLLASAPQAYIRHLETAADRAVREARWAAEKADRVAAKVSSAYLGTVKAKLEVKGTITAIRYIHGNYGTTVLYTITTTDNQTVKWFASSEVLGTDENVAVHIIGTVKAHEEYQGEKQTLITRANKVNPDTGKPFSARKTNEHTIGDRDDDGNFYYLHDNTPHSDCESCYELAHDQAD